VCDAPLFCARVNGAGIRVINLSLVSVVTFTSGGVAAGVLAHGRGAVECFVGVDTRPGGRITCVICAGIAIVTACRDIHMIVALVEQNKINLNYEALVGIPIRIKVQPAIIG
jgi:hypothetical protein